MGDLTKNIFRRELRCKCCAFTILDYEPVIQAVQQCCDFFATEYDVSRVVLIVTSAARCNTYNLSVGSNDRSQHARAAAMDIQIYASGKQVPPADVFRYFTQRYPSSGGLGLYDDFVHVDMRPVKARWWGLC